jgi:hypothetical protein
MEISLPSKQSTIYRGRWSLRLDNELLDAVQKEDMSWSSVASTLGFSVEVVHSIEYDIVGV